MNPNLLTERAQQALASAQSLVQEHRNATLDIDQLIYALVTQDGGIVPRILTRLNIDTEQLTEQLKLHLESLPQLQYSGEATVSGNFRKLLQDAESEMRSFGDEYISVEHLFLAALNQQKNGAIKILNQAG